MLFRGDTNKGLGKVRKRGNDGCVLEMYIYIHTHKYITLGSCDRASLM